jgi:tRNA-uridine 2-sulfurtransferase
MVNARIMTMKRKGVRVGMMMSGGVDSSLAASLLKSQGYDVIGITLKLWDYESAGYRPKNERGCCDITAQLDARYVCSQIDIDHIVIDLKEVFKREVILPYEDAYLQGLTPNPCISCNTKLKWGSVIKKADELQLDYIATGHYAKIVHGREGVRLEKGIDKTKDQSYALWEIPKSTLARTLLPLGNWKKSDLRIEANRLNLKTANKPDSQEVCFISDQYKDHLSETRSKEVEEIGQGEIVNLDGKVVGIHDGFYGFTIGQRKGLNISDGKGPYYVSDIEPESNRVVVGSRKSLARKGLIAQKINWLSFDPPTQPEKCIVKIRYNDSGSPAWVIPECENEVRIEFKNTLDAVTPGQSAVWYKGNSVWGGGIITKALKND